MRFRRDPPRRFAGNGSAFQDEADRHRYSRRSPISYHYEIRRNQRDDYDSRDRRGHGLGYGRFERERERPRYEDHDNASRYRRRNHAHRLSSSPKQSKKLSSQRLKDFSKQRQQKHVLWNLVQSIIVKLRPMTKTV